ncbi:MAG: hypothetical protein ABIF10_02590 [Candidatus Woesearchaeota archaeon]
MAIVGFNFNKMSAERMHGVEGKINIKNNVSIKDITRQDLSLGSNKEPALKFIFDFSSDYEPEVGLISLTGDVTYIASEKEVQEVLKEWKKDRKINKELLSTIVNHLLARCNVQALILSREVNLPPPIPLPKLTPNIK